MTIPKYPDGYEPTDWVQDVVDNHYQAGDGTIYECFGYDPRRGFWMRAIDGCRTTNVSERAIGRTFHKVRDRTAT